jgi:hypothetical protein
MLPAGHPVRQFIKRGRSIREPPPEGISWLD